ncbi:cubilin-like isoform X3 [Acropora muricata]|uniref:cubilin-like isoform X3 n=1 Tax=Acropora muricata TaxID=159855 RepID=UPI0034E5FFE3
MLLFIGLSLLFKLYITEACTANQQSLVHLTATENSTRLLNGSSELPSNATCRWNITAPVGKVLRVEINFVFLNGPCEDEQARIFDGPGNSSDVIKTFCGMLSSLEIYFSSGRSFFLEAKTGWGSQPRFFVVDYQSVDLQAHSCSASNTNQQNLNILFQNSSGVLKSPGYPSPYPVGLVGNCLWRIVAPKGQVIRLEFLSIRLGKGFICCLEIEDGGRKISKCNTQPSPLSLYSKSRELTLKMKTSSCSPGPGFIANYSFVPDDLSSGSCNLSSNSVVQITGEGGSFSSPGYPYPSRGTCCWNITVPSGKLVKLTFLDFDGYCNRNYAEVFDEPNSGKEVLTGKICREKAVFSKRNSLYVKYSVILEDRYWRGFWASYEAVDPVGPASYSCSGEASIVASSAGEFASYDYPLIYPNDASCSWQLRVPPTHIVQLTFTSFELQPSPSCGSDYVEVRQGRNIIETELVGKFCGATPPAPFLSNHSMVYVKLVTDSSERYPGFKATFRAIQNPSLGPCKLQGEDNVISLTGTTGRLFSPLYPQIYPPNMTCTWMITVPKGKFVKLKISSFFLEIFCNGPSLKIRDGQSESSDLLKSFCGRKFESSLFSSGRHLWVRFHSPNKKYLRGTGFNAVFEAVNQLPASFSCSEEKKSIRLKSETGTLASYNYPLPYDANIECIWLIDVDHSYNVKLSFEFFNLSSSSDCSEDYVMVRDGLYSSSDVVGKFCGSNKPQSITSDAWDLRVEFKSSGKAKFPGFKARYEVKRTTGHILKIVGGVVGGLSALCTVLGFWCKYRSSNCCNGNAVPRVHNGVSNNGADDFISKDKTTPL